MPAAQPSTEALFGLTLEQYAGVTAALAEGFSLGAILANEGLEPEAWPAADVAWKTRIAGDGAEGPVLAELREKLAVAEDCLARRVEPIDADFGAWMSFLSAWAKHPAPFELLTGAGLGMNDIARLQRRWARRLAEDAALQKEAAELAKKGAGPLPTIVAEAAELEPFPWSKGPSQKQDEDSQTAVAAPPAGGLSVLDLSFYRYIAAKAHLAEHPGDEEHVRVKMALADFPTLDAAWQARLKANPALLRDYHQLLRHERGRAHSTAKRAESVPIVGEALAADKPPPAPSSLGGTALAVDVPRGPALPFAGNPDAAPPASLGEALAADKPPPPRNPLGGTALAVDVPRGPALPFAGNPDAAPPAKKAKRLGELAMNLPIPDHLLRKQGATPPEAPELTLEQHASLCFEIGAAPEKAAEALSRYQLTAAQKEQIDRRFAERFLREPGSREAWESAYRAYGEWWKARGA